MERGWGEGNWEEKDVITGEPKLWPISWANVNCETFGGTRLL